MSTAPDSRASKQILAIGFSLAIGLLAVFQGTIKAFRNKWLLLIPVYLVFNIIICPHVELVINNIDSGDFYFWKPFAIVLCFTLMIVAIASMEIDFDYVINVMVICGAVMSGYIILQYFGFDQFWVAKDGNQFTAVRMEALGGNLGQPTLVASFVVMMIPLAIYLKKYLLAVLITIGTLITGSAMAMSAMVVMFLMWLVRWKVWTVIPIIIISIFLTGLFCYVPAFKQKIIDRMDGRWATWTNIYKDIHDGQIGDGKKFPFTGVGLGRFSYLFPQKHNSGWQQAHNDLYEFTYDCGFIGVLILLSGVLSMILFHYSCVDSNISLAILLSFVGIFICSLGGFPFQLGAHQFYAAVLVGFLNNESIRRIR